MEPKKRDSREDVIIEVELSDGDSTERVEEPTPTAIDKSKVGKVVGSIAFYVFVSLSMVFVNKFIFSVSKHRFDFPLTVTMYQVFFTAVLMLVLCPLNEAIPQFRAVMELPKFRDLFSFAHVKAAAPSCIVFVTMVSFNNFCLHFVDVTLYLVFRSLTVLFVVLLTYFLLGQKTGILTLLAILVVSSGYIVGSVGGFSNQSYDKWSILLGLICGVCASIFVALNSIYVKKVLKTEEFQGDFWLFLFYQNLISFGIFVVVVCVSGELPGVLEFPHYSEPDFILVTMFSAALGFLINLAYNFLIENTSPLTKETVATTKACLQPILGAVLFNDPLNFLTVVGAGVCIFGSFLYSLVKYFEGKKKKAAGPK